MGRSFPDGTRSAGFGEQADRILPAEAHSLWAPHMKNYLKTFLTPETRRQFTRVFVIGIFNTVLYFVLSNLFRSGLGWDTGWAVGGAFIIGAVILAGHGKRGGFYGCATVGGGIR